MRDETPHTEKKRTGAGRNGGKARALARAERGKARALTKTDTAKGARGNGARSNHGPGMHPI